MYIGTSRLPYCMPCKKVIKFFICFTGPSNGYVKIPRVESPTEQQSATDTPDGVSKLPSKQQVLPEEEKKASGTNKESAQIVIKLGTKQYFPYVLHCTALIYCITWTSSTDECTHAHNNNANVQCHILIDILPKKVKFA